VEALDQLADELAALSLNGCGLGVTPEPLAPDSPVDHTFPWIQPPPPTTVCARQSPPRQRYREMSVEECRAKGWEYFRSFMEPAPGYMPIPAWALCPITHQPMLDPVFSHRDGYHYERSALEKWLEHHSTSPMTGQPMRSRRKKKKKKKNTIHLSSLVGG
jgi:hypothetical protein